MIRALYTDNLLDFTEVKQQARQKDWRIDSLLKKDQNEERALRELIADLWSNDKESRSFAEIRRGQEGYTPYNMILPHRNATIAYYMVRELKGWVWRHSGV